MTIAERLQQAGVTASPAELSAAAEAAAAQFRLPFSRQSWRGQTGNWAGAGVGSSIDFQDHRPYVPGDDPRYINWQAYARSGNYTMKLYREEVRPQTDLVLDVSASMFAEPQKAARALELFHFACHSAWRCGSQLNVSVANGSASLRLPPQSLYGHSWELPEQAPRSAPAPDPSHLFSAARSMRVVISDFLFEQDPAAWLAQLARSGSQAVLFCLHTQAEAEPDWLGDVQLEDCESGKRVQQHFTREDIDTYRSRYRAHFALWEQETVRHRASFTRIAAEGTLAQQLLAAAGPHGGIELCN